MYEVVIHHPEHLEHTRPDLCETDGCSPDRCHTVSETEVYARTAVKRDVAQLIRSASASHPDAEVTAREV